MVVAGVVVVASQTLVNPLASLDQRLAIEPQNIEVSTTRALDRVFSSVQYDWPPTTERTVPPIILSELPDDFAEGITPTDRQDLFLRALLPIVLIENRRIREQRELAQWLLEDEPPTEDSPMHDWLMQLAKELRVRGDFNDPKVQTKILERLDEIPPALALSQAALESGWGTSRFALEGNSLFGQWTFQTSEGLEPSERNSDANHLVASFPNLRASVRAYMHNLNIGHAYSEFRKARAIARANGDIPIAYNLAGYLQRYSERGEEYVDELRRMINSRRIAILSHARLGHVEQKLAEVERIAQAGS